MILRILQSWSISRDLWMSEKNPGVAPKALKKSDQLHRFYVPKKSVNQSLPDLCQTCSPQKIPSGCGFSVFNWFNVLNSKKCLVSLVIRTQIKTGHVPSVSPKLSCINSDNHPFLTIAPHHQTPLESPPIYFCQTTCSKRSRTREAPIPAKISTNSEALMLKKGTPASPKGDLRGVVNQPVKWWFLEPGGFGIRIGVWVGPP